MANPLPGLPTYTEHVAGGGTQEIEIIDDMAETWAKNDPETWAEHADKWAAYQQEFQQAQERLNDRMWQAVMRRAIQVEMPKDEAWIEDQALYGVQVPDDPTARRIHYIRTEVIGGMSDVWKITAMANGTYLSEEALSLAEASFRDSLARTLLAGLTSYQGAVEAGDDGGRDDGGQGVGPEAE